MALANMISSAEGRINNNVNTGNTGILQDVGQLSHTTLKSIYDAQGKLSSDLCGLGQTTIKSVYDAQGKITSDMCSDTAQLNNLISGSASRIMDGACSDARTNLKATYEAAQLASATAERNGLATRDAVERNGIASRETTEKKWSIFKRCN